MTVGTRFRFRLEIAAESDIGRERAKNDDSYMVLEADTIAFGVCDGMGGHAGGDVASRLAVDTITSVLGAGTEPEEGLDERLRRAIVVASRKILERANAEPSLRSMGTTATIAALDAEEIVVAQVGDSRAYLFREGVLTRLTRDQTLAQSLVDQGQLALEELANSEYAHIVLQAVGMKELPDVVIGRARLADGDLVLICSDGLFGPLGDAAIAEILSRETALEAKVRALVERANAAGGPDNITCVLARAECVSTRERDSEATLPALPIRRFWWW